MERVKTPRVKIFGGKYDGYRIRGGTIKRPAQVCKSGENWKTAPQEIIDALKLWEQSPYKDCVGIGAFIAKMFGK